MKAPERAYQHNAESLCAVGHRVGADHRRIVCSAGGRLSAADAAA
jgi:hypothetical protein